MKNALISPKEQAYSYDGILLGQRIAEVADVAFEVALPLHWIECADDVTAQDWYFNSYTNTCELKPISPEIPEIEVPNIPPETILNVD